MCRADVSLKHPRSAAASQTLNWRCMQGRPAEAPKLCAWQMLAPHLYVTTPHARQQHSRSPVPAALELTGHCLQGRPAEAPKLRAGQMSASALPHGFREDSAREAHALQVSFFSGLQGAECRQS